MDKLPYIALAYAWVLIFVARQFATVAMKEQTGGYNNRDPRAQQATLEGRGRRALGAHLNSFEAFAPFAAAVLAALARRPSDLIAWLAIAFCAIRTLYVWAYVTDQPGLRSGMWALGMFVTAGLFSLAIIGS